MRAFDTSVVQKPLVVIRLIGDNTEYRNERIKPAQRKRVHSITFLSI